MLSFFGPIWTKWLVIMTLEPHGWTIGWCLISRHFPRDTLLYDIAVGTHTHTHTFWFLFFQNTTLLGLSKEVSINSDIYTLFIDID